MTSNAAAVRPAVVAERVDAANAFDAQRIVATFAPGAYKAAQVAAILGQMSRLGYNAVRVFVNVNEIGAVHGNGLNPGELARIAELITKANADGIRVLLCTGQLPTRGGYMPRPNALLAGSGGLLACHGEKWRLSSSRARLSWASFCSKGRSALAGSR